MYGEQSFYALSVWFCAWCLDILAGTMTMRKTNNNSHEYSIMVVGVGGQGVVLLSNILGTAAIHEGYSVMSSETHGMAQRGGSVESHIRLNGMSPLIPTGGADIMIALEPLEAARSVWALSKKSIAIISTHVLPPTSVLREEADMPSMDELLAYLKRRCNKVVPLDIVKAAQSLGEQRAANVCALGAASPFLPLDDDVLKRAIAENVPPKAVDVNISAFQLGGSEEIGDTKT